MLYRVALGLGLLLLGAYIGRELSRTQPVRTSLKDARPLRLDRPTPSGGRSKVFLH